MMDSLKLGIAVNSVIARRMSKAIAERMIGYDEAQMTGALKKEGYAWDSDGYPEYVGGAKESEE